MINFIIETEENDNNNKEYCSCEVTEQLQIIKSYIYKIKQIEGKEHG